MNVEVGAEAALFPGKEFRSGIFLAVCIMLIYMCVGVKELKKK
jgi:hypothetical protein